MSAVKAEWPRRPSWRGASRSGGTKDRRNRPGEERERNTAAILSTTTQTRGRASYGCGDALPSGGGDARAPARATTERPRGRRGTISSLSFGAATTCHTFHRQQCEDKPASRWWACLPLAVQPSTQAHRGLTLRHRCVCCTGRRHLRQHHDSSWDSALLATAGLSSVFTIVAKDSNYSAWSIRRHHLRGLGAVFDVKPPGHGLQCHRLSAALSGRPGRLHLSSHH